MPLLERRPMPGRNEALDEREGRMIGRGATMVAVALRAGTAAHAAPAALLVEASPSARTTVAAPVDQVTLRFARTVELVGLSVLVPGGGEQAIVAANYAPGGRSAKARAFAFSVAPPLTAPGAYQLSYLARSRGVPSLNGFVAFTIGGQ